VVVLGALVLMTLALTTAFAAQQPFADVPQDHWAYDAISRLAQSGVLEGYPDGTFKGKRNMTRYEFAVAIARMIDQLGQASQGPQGSKGDQGPVGPAGPPGTGGLTEEQRTLLERLATEFEPELRALRADLDTLTNRVAALEGKGPMAPRVTITGNFGWRTGSYGTKINFSESTASTGYPAFLNQPAFGNIPIVVDGAVVGLIPISDGLKDAFKVNDFMAMRTYVNINAALGENTSAMVSLLASPNTNVLSPGRTIGTSAGTVVSPSAFSGNGVMDGVQFDQIWVKYGTRFLTPVTVTVVKQ
jgi:hypothetical protein